MTHQHGNHIKKENTIQNKKSDMRVLNATA